MAGKKIDKVSAGIVLLLILVLTLGVLVKFVFAYDNACGGDTMWPTVEGIITDEYDDPIKGVNVTAYSNGLDTDHATTTYLGGYLINLNIPSDPTNVTLNATKNGISTSAIFSIGCAENRVINMTLGIEKPDIAINQFDISFNPEIPTEFQTTTITAAINNTGNSDVGAEGVSDLNVSFYKDNLNNLIGTDMIELAANSQNTASVNWTAELGNHTIIVVADADNEIIELNENNNNANKTINVISNEDFIKQDNVVFRYIYTDNDNESMNGAGYLPELENIFSNRILVETKYYVGGEWETIACAHVLSCSMHIPLTRPIGKKSINTTGNIDYDKVNYTGDFNETENETFNQWIKNICY